MPDFPLKKQILLSFAANCTEHREDLSAVYFTSDNYLWLGSDETSTIERLSKIDAEKFAEHKQFRVAEFIDLPAPEDEEIDIEGISFHNNYLWFVGSHSYKRKRVKPDKSDKKNVKRLSTVVTEPNRYVLGRIPLINGELLSSSPDPDNSEIQLTAAKLEVTQQGNLLMEALAEDSHLGAFIKAAIPGKDNGLDIEGIVAVNNRIFLGLRGPVLRGWALILEIELEESAPGLLKLGKIGCDGELYKKHFIYLNGLGIRDLYLDGEDLLILAGPTMDLDGPVYVYSLRNGINLRGNILSQPEIILQIPHGNRDDRAEGIALFQDVSGQDICGETRLLVVYDSPSQTKRLVGETGVIADVFEFNRK